MKKEISDVHLVDSNELELMKDCKSITYALLDLFDNGDMAQIYALAKDCGTNRHIEILNDLKEMVSERFYLTGTDE